MKFDLTISNILSIFTWFLKNQVWNFFQKSNWTNLIFSLFQTRFLQATGSKDQVPNRLKIKFVQRYLWKKFQTRFFKNQVQMDSVSVTSNQRGIFFSNFRGLLHYLHYHKSNIFLKSSTYFKCNFIWNLDPLWKL